MNGRRKTDPEDVNRAARAATSTASGLLHGCACRWDEHDHRVVTCERHQGWLDVIAEWSERAKSAEGRLDAIANG